MKKVLAIVLLLVFTQSFGQSLHPNYKAQLNKKLESTNIYFIKKIEIKKQIKDLNGTPKYRKNSENIFFLDHEKAINKHQNYKQHVQPNGNNK